MRTTDQSLAAQSITLRQAASASPGSWLEMLNLRPHAHPLRQSLCFDISLGYLCIQGSLESTAQEGGMRKWELKCQGSGGYGHPSLHHFTSLDFPLHTGKRKTGRNTRGSLLLLSQRQNWAERALPVPCSAGQGHGDLASRGASR